MRLRRRRLLFHGFQDLLCLPEVAAIMRPNHHESCADSPGEQSQKWISEADAIQIEIARFFNHYSHLIMATRNDFSTSAPLSCAAGLAFFGDLSFLLGGGSSSLINQRPSQPG